MFNCVGHSPAWPLIPYALAELRDAGLDHQPFVPPVWNDAVMLALGPAGDCRGFIAYRVDEMRSGWFIMLSYVPEDFRRQGIHTALFEALVARAKAKGDILRIESGTHVDNIAAQRAFERQGRHAVAIHYTYNVKHWLDGKEPTDVS